jgi:leucyl/phenylalanyl-tRNA---protein transferase
VIAWISDDRPFPPLERALNDPNGLLAAGGDLSPYRLIRAYRSGVFPWYSEGQPILWWSPDPRMVLYIDEFRVSRSLRKRVRQNIYQITFDTAFVEVVRNCARVSRTGQYGTWITPAIIDAYACLHELGYAHSVEAWLGDQLVGGLYGLALGRMFFGESMFASRTDASKVALVALAGRLEQLGIPLIDCQQETSHLASFGARPIARRRFAAHLGELINSEQPPGAWSQGVASCTA